MCRYVEDILVGRINDRISENVDLRRENDRLRVLVQEAFMVHRDDDDWLRRAATALAEPEEGNDG